MHALLRYFHNLHEQELIMLMHRLPTSEQISLDFIYSAIATLVLNKKQKLITTVLQKIWHLQLFNTLYRMMDNSF